VPRRARYAAYAESPSGHFLARSGAAVPVPIGPRANLSTLAVGFRRCWACYALCALAGLPTVITSPPDEASDWRQVTGDSPSRWPAYPLGNCSDPGHPSWALTSMHPLPSGPAPPWPWWQGRHQSRHRRARSTRSHLGRIEPEGGQAHLRGARARYPSHWSLPQLGQRPRAGRRFRSRDCGPWHPYRILAAGRRMWPRPNAMLMSRARPGPRTSVAGRASNGVERERRPGCILRASHWSQEETWQAWKQGGRGIGIDTTTRVANRSRLPYLVFFREGLLGPWTREPMTNSRCASTC
jgi:hypothetical protein